MKATDDDGYFATQDINITVINTPDPLTFGGATSGSGNEDEDHPITGTLTATDAEIFIREAFICKTLLALI